MHSLRGRLVGTLLTIFIGAWVIAGIYLCQQFTLARSGSMDAGLDEVARIILLSMPNDIDHVSSATNLQLPSGESAHLEKIGRLSFQVWVKAGREMAVRSAGAPDTPFRPDFLDGFSTAQLAGEEWRTFAISDAHNRVQVQVGKPTSELGAELRQWLYVALAISVLALLVVGIGLKLVVRWSLKPVVTVQSAIMSREPLDLTPLPDRGLPCEVQPLVSSFNRLLARFAHTLRTERRFFTDAAHELRTPLAVLLTQAQVAQRARTLEEARASLDQLVRGVERSARLSQQLLDSARLDIERHAGEQAPVELADIVAVVTHEFSVTTTQKNQSITLNTAPALIRGNVDELGILVRNLLDNALRYAGEGCRVAIRCARESQTVQLEVRDDGPGVPEADRERIFDRFYRGAGNGERGSGIGLSLVARIAQSHDATIRTGVGLDGGGFGILLSFPALEESAASSDDSGSPIELRTVVASS